MAQAQLLLRFGAVTAHGHPEVLALPVLQVPLVLLLQFPDPPDRLVVPDKLDHPAHPVLPQQYPAPPAVLEPPAVPALMDPPEAPDLLDRPDHPDHLRLCPDLPDLPARLETHSVVELLQDLFLFKARLQPRATLQRVLMKR